MEAAAREGTSWSFGGPLPPPPCGRCSVSGLKTQQLATQGKSKPIFDVSTVGGDPGRGGRPPPRRLAQRTPSDAAKPAAH